MFTIYEFSLGINYPDFFALEALENLRGFLTALPFREEGYKREPLFS